MTEKGICPNKRQNLVCRRCIRWDRCQRDTRYNFRRIWHTENYYWWQSLSHIFDILLLKYIECNCWSIVHMIGSTLTQRNLRGTFQNTGIGIKKGNYCKLYSLIVLWYNRYINLNPTNWKYFRMSYINHNSLRSPGGNLRGIEICKIWDREHRWCKQMNFSRIRISSSWGRIINIDFSLGGRFCRIFLSIRGNHRMLNKGCSLTCIIDNGGCCYFSILGRCRLYIWVNIFLDKEINCRNIVDSLSGLLNLQNSFNLL